MSDEPKAITPLYGELVEVIHAPEHDVIYALYRDKTDHFIHINMLSTVYTSAMPSLESARQWVESDRARRLKERP